MSDGFLLFAPEEIQELLRKVPKGAQQKGDQFFRGGHVLEVNCVEEGCEYEALVRGRKTYKASFFYDDIEGWDANCTCHEGTFCEHIYAGFKTLLAEHSVAQVQNLSSTGKLTPTSSNQPPSFAQKVSESLGRPLKKVELEYLKNVGALYREGKENGQVSQWNLRLVQLPICEPATFGIRISPFPIRDELEFWLCLARAARNRNIPIPDWLKPISDLTGVDAKFARWERSKEIRNWRERLAKAASSQPLPDRSPFSGCDLRVKIRPGSAGLEWKPAVEGEFRMFTNQEITTFLIDYDSGLVEISPQATILWHAFSQRFALSGSIELFQHDTQAGQLLNRLLRSPSLIGHFVNERDQTFQWMPDPLRWDMKSPDGGEGTYRLRLVDIKGDPIGATLRIFEGQPTLYVTRDAVYKGPAVGRQIIDYTKENEIPSEALESAEGLALLSSLQVELPARLKDRVRRDVMEVSIRCNLEVASASEEVEHCIFNVTAESNGGRKREFWDGMSWRSQPDDFDEEPTEVRSEKFIIIEDRSTMNQVPGLLTVVGAERHPTLAKVALRVTRKFPELFAGWLSTLPPEITVHLAGELSSFIEGRISGRVKLDISEASPDWFDLRVVVDVSDTELTPEEVRLLLNARGKFVRLDGKGWKRLKFDITQQEDEELARIGLTPRDLSAEPQRLHVLQLADQAARRFLPEEQYTRIERRAEELKTRVTPPIPVGVKAELRPYQEEGYHFLAYLSTNNFGGILADDMGLGKTLQTLTWLLWLHDRTQDDSKKPAKIILPSLVVCPKSVMDNWRAETEKFTPSLRVKVWPAAGIDTFMQELSSADLHVINYNQLRILGEMLSPVEWQAVILDEGQYIKNPSSQTAQIARGLKAKQRLVLTGTPIENRLLDLWSLMAFAMPGMLGNRSQFGRLYDSKEDPMSRRRLSARVRPFLLRRTKGQVAKDLPERIEEDILCEMETEQKALYTAELKRAQQLLLKVQTQKQLAKQQFHFLTSLLRLRQICCSPRLVNPAAESEGAKIEALLDQLEPILDEGHKVLVFSQFVEMLELLRTAIKARNWPLFYLAGSTENRGPLVQEFQEAKGSAVFLISLKAGGFGLNLTAASYVVLFDPWWNPAVEAQAIDRTHRIGQKNNVMAYRLLIRGSVEEKIRILQRRKSALAENVLGEEKFSQSLTLEDLHFLFAD